MTNQTSTSNASPRPWRVGSADTSDYMGDLPRGSYYIDDASMEVIAEISSCGVPLPRHRANAALIVEAVNEHDRLTAENARLREALDGAARSLATIARDAGISEYMDEFSQVRAYAQNRSNVAQKAAERIQSIVNTAVMKGEFKGFDGVYLNTATAIIREECAAQTNEYTKHLEQDKRELGVMLERVIMRIVPDTPIYNDARSLLERMKTGYP